MKHETLVGGCRDGLTMAVERDRRQLVVAVPVSVPAAGVHLAGDVTTFKQQVYERHLISFPGEEPLSYFVVEGMSPRNALAKMIAEYGGK